MAATLEQIEAALLSPWVPIADGGLGLWAETDQSAIAWDNLTFDPTTLPAGTPWMEVSTSAGSLRRVGVGNLYFGTPTIIISAHTPLNTGKTGARALIDTAAAMYRDRQFIAGNSPMFAYAFSQPVEMPFSGYYKLSLQISFKLF